MSLTSKAGGPDLPGYLIARKTHVGMCQPQFCVPWGWKRPWKSSDSTSFLHRGGESNSKAFHGHRRISSRAGSVSPICDSWEEGVHYPFSPPPHKAWKGTSKEWSLFLQQLYVIQKNMGFWVKQKQLESNTIGILKMLPLDAWFESLISSSVTPWS